MLRSRFLCLTVGGIGKSRRGEEEALGALTLTSESPWEDNEEEQVEDVEEKAVGATIVVVTGTA